MLISEILGLYIVAIFCIIIYMIYTSPSKNKQRLKAVEKENGLLNMKLHILLSMLNPISKAQYQNKLDEQIAINNLFKWAYNDE